MNTNKTYKKINGLINLSKFLFYNIKYCIYCFIQQMLIEYVLSFN